MRKVKWGVLGVAKIAVEKVIPAMQRGEASHIAAIASRDLGKARAAADKLGIERAFGSYEELLADGEIEAVYNPLPNELHVPWTIRALEAGKHVLCEKPIALDAEEARALIATRAAHRQACRRSLHGALPSAMAAREGTRAAGAVGDAARDPDVLLLSPARPRECPQPAAGRRRPLRHRLLRHPIGALHFRRRADARGGDDRPRPEFPDRPAGRRDSRIPRRAPFDLHRRDAIVGASAGHDRRRRGADRGR